MFFKVPGGINRTRAVRNRTIVYDFINTRLSNQLLVQLKQNVNL
jgi:hypothetical protein